MSLDDLLSGNSKNKTNRKSTNNEPKKQLNKEEEKEYKTLYLKKKDIELFNKILLTQKLQKRKYTISDCFGEAVELLAKNKKIEYT